MTTADIFNVGVTVKGPDGKVYTLRRPDQYEQGEFQRWLEQCAHDAVDRSTDSEERKDRRHHLIDVDAGLGMYEWAGPHAEAAKWTPAGLTKIVEIICRSQGVATAEKAEELTRHAFREIAAGILKTRLTDPKAYALALAALGLPTDWQPSESSAPSSSSSSTPPGTDPTPNSPDSTTTNSCSSTPPSAPPTGP